ncbi:hypothetical protein DBIPINDM_007426 (plasmid) [Mesorhizobium sp. AR02]|uniref:hypothetical protein n=1 Tax=Mesorhizobium sp. AR02 TaxID=2865837 RepID=UPI002160757A|nr:hypothetical protein [Mesorhizobium sp. AR02]UVK50137.1 hypothetical protein DBIPINDM_007426 [Mesorhizobium sp. AR02]
MIDLTDAPVSALLELHGDLLAELRRRKIVRSANNPTGDYGELLFSRAFGWTLNSNSSADADAIDTEGVRYQIKCRKLETLGGSRQLGFIRRLPDRPFDRLAAVLLDGKFRVTRAAIIPYEVVEPRRTSIASKAGGSCCATVCDIPGVMDVTPELRAAEQAI